MSREPDQTELEAMLGEASADNRRLRAEVERLTAIVQQHEIWQASLIQQLVDKDAEIEQLKAENQVAWNKADELDERARHAEAEIKRLNKMLAWCDQMEPGIKRRSEIAIEDEPWNGGIA